MAIWNNLILSVAAEQRRRLLPSEELQHGFIGRGTPVVDPFAKPDHERIDVAVDSHRR